MTFTDLAPAAQRMSDLISSVPDDLLSGPTPCRSYALGDLLDHVDGLALAFTAAATKSVGDGAPQGPVGNAARLGDDWRTRIPRHLAALTQAWRDPAARTGMTRAGGIDMPGEVAAVVALEELVIHGWDVARASGQAYDCAEPTLEVVRGFVAQFAGPDQADLRGEAYGTPVAVAQAAPLLDHVVGLAGRDPAWSAH
jgi:uncharacterized protein (TIGR03086 family)